MGAEGAAGVEQMITKLEQLKGLIDQGILITITTIIYLTDYFQQLLLLYYST